MNILRYLKSLAQTNSGQSSKAFTLIVSVIVSAIIGLSISFSIIYDVCSDGKIDSSLQDMGILMLCTGGFIGGSSVSKIFGDQAEGETERFKLKLESKSDSNE